mmetsp:Transcript_46512/g.86965  ORF Transcript_46512/g.86965 Transcript_46512/m.86965 type:complete len:378 (+) Transcript_46512:73-1206(+)
MGCHLTKPWIAVGCTLPLVDKTLDDDEDCEERWCWCLYYHRHMRDMEVVVDPNAPLESKDAVQPDVPRSPPGREVQVGTPALEEDTPKSTASSQITPAEIPQLEEVPEFIRKLAVSIAMASGDAGTPEVAGMPLAEFWRKMVASESSSGKRGGAQGRAEKFLLFRKNYSWPLSVGVHHVETALRSGANVYLPPRWAGDSPLVVFTAQKVNTRLCSMQEHQKLIMFMLEAAFRDSAPGRGGVTIVLDVRLLSNVFWQAAVAGFSDAARAVAMCSALPMKATHVQLIEDEAGAWIANLALELLLKKLSSKMRSRINRGGPQAAIDGLGEENLPDFLGGCRSSAEFSTWLEQLQLTSPSTIADAALPASVRRAQPRDRQG